MTYGRGMGLGALPNDYYGPDGSFVNQKYVNQVVMPDGSLVSAASVVADPNRIGPPGELESHIAQNAWAMATMPQGGGKYSISYSYTGAMPATGAINSTGGQGNPNGGVDYYSGQYTPGGYIPSVPEGITPPAPAPYIPPPELPPSSGAQPSSGGGGGGIMDTPPAMDAPAPTDFPEYDFNGSHTPQDLPPVIIEGTMDSPQQAGIGGVGLLALAGVAAFLLFGKGRK